MHRSSAILYQDLLSEHNTRRSPQLLTLMKAKAEHLFPCHTVAPRPCHFPSGSGGRQRRAFSGCVGPYEGYLQKERHRITVAREQKSILLARVIWEMLTSFVRDAELFSSFFSVLVFISGSLSHFVSVWLSDCLFTLSSPDV